MKVFAISDLHLSTTSSKPMDVFGVRWQNYVEKIRADWMQKVTDEDVVLIAGDISWAMKLDDAIVDINTLADLPGKKVMIRGNHDYWWNGISKIRAAKKMRQATQIQHSTFLDEMQGFRRLRVKLFLFVTDCAVRPSGERDNAC